MLYKVTFLALLFACCQGVIVKSYPEVSTGYVDGYHGYPASSLYERNDIGLGYGHGYGYDKDYHAYPKYKYSYGVSDPHTGDHKSQEEHRDGDVVKGHYTVADPDGTLRVVHYIADHNGFRAVVEKHGESIHPQPIHPPPVVVEKIVPGVDKVVPIVEGAAPIVEKVIYEKPLPYGSYEGYGYGPYGYDHGHSNYEY